ncbi:jg9758 [Pararge aegeria aegeria]|uniref:Jg9758 protein n=1 Tax=Pararge aegeria aegeria TaxID=348720 RepID=A0A8S4RL04_9NEOP|nr:jg9758 [Pararge aegeria aegeria]
MPNVPCSVVLADQNTVVTTRPLPTGVVRDDREAFSQQVPPYLKRLLEAYLQDREVIWEGSDGWIYRHLVCCGVPQGSVLGPILWNIGFDWLLRGPLLPGMRVLCYADDTLVTACGNTYEDAARLAVVGTSMVVDRIRMIGLKVSISKTEAILSIIHRPRRGPPRGAYITVLVLGLTLDGRWGFKAHFTQLGPRLVSTAAALGRLLPNIGGPESTCRRLYAGIVRSMALYGAPIWMHAMTTHNKILLRRPQRIIAVRTIRGYRTVSSTAATFLASDPPWELQAEVLAEVYRYRAEMRTQGESLDAEEVRRIRTLAQAALVSRWKEDLESPIAGSWTVDAIRHKKKL